jgi:hypothetical protein
VGLTYASERDVFFDPKRIKPGKCLACGTATTRISPRTIAAKTGTGYGTLRIRRMSKVLMLCERCDMRWSIAAFVGIALVLSPLWLPGVLVWATIQNHYLPDIVLLYGIAVSFPLALASWIWARSKLIQCRSIDDDGTIGLRNVHRGTRDAIVALGEADYAPGSGA